MKAILAMLAEMPLFSELSADELAEIAAATRPLRARRGDIICHAGEHAVGFHYVIDGQIKLVLLAADGSEKVMDIVRAGMSFGEALIFMDKPCPVYAEAIEDSALLFIEGAAVLRALDSSPLLARHMLASLSRRLHHMIADVESYCLQPAGQRIIGYLLREGEPEPGSASRVRVELPVSKAILASRLNITPETLSRVLHCLAREGLISVRGRTIHVHDINKLRTCGPLTTARARV